MRYAAPIWWMVRRRNGAALDRLLPRRCVLCGLASGPRNLCPGCARDLPRCGPCCSLCGLGLAEGREGPCPACLENPPPWQAALAALDYVYPVDRLVCRFKYNRVPACGEVLGRELLAALRRGSADRPGCILPVPLHRARHALRSFNQAERLARQVGGGLGIPVPVGMLRRRRHTRAQSGLDAALRKKNLKGAFSWRPPDGRKIPGHIALVDDVMTTGATLAECSRLLRRKGVERISVWVAARAPDPRILGE